MLDMATRVNATSEAGEHDDATISLPWDQIGSIAHSADPPDRTSSVPDEGSTTARGGVGVCRPVPVIHRHTPVHDTDRFLVLQEYEGVVITLERDSFWARLVNRTTRGAPDEEAEFLMEEVSSCDRRLVAEGAVFYWHIGYRDGKNGQRTRAALIRFRRLPAVVDEVLEVARREASALLADFERWAEDAESSSDNPA